MPETSSLVASLTGRISDASPWIFVGAVAFLAVWETLRPAVTVRLPGPRRWALHFLLFLLPSLFHRLLPGIGTVALALAIRPTHRGLLHHDAIPYAVQFVLTILTLDFLDYWRHTAHHRVPLLWRVHLVHHSDREFDFTNSARFHPFEFVLKDGVSWLAVAVMAPPPLAVVVWVVWVSVNALFLHSNVEVPESLARILRLAVFTPALHRIHHAQDEAAQQTNMGNLFVFWDHCFGTFQIAQAGGRKGFEVGLKEVPPIESVRLRHVLAAPFQPDSGAGGKDR